jgi:hypothetical protein
MVRCKWYLCIVSLILTGCDDSKVSSPDVPCEFSLIFDRPTPSVPIGETAQVKVRHSSECANSRTPNLAWAVSDPTVVATISLSDSASVIRGIALGTAQITAVSAQNLAVDTITVTVAVPSVDRDQFALFQTDSLHYRLSAKSHGYEGRIAYTFTNRTQAPVYIVNCNGITSLWMEKWIDGRWMPAWSPVIPACLSPPIVVQPNATYNAGIFVFSGYPGTRSHPQFSVPVITGVYRVVWKDVLSSYQDRAYPFGAPIPLEMRVSNRFVIEAPNRAQ